MKFFSSIGTCFSSFFWWFMCLINGFFVAMGIGLIVVAAVVLAFAKDNEAFVENGFYSIPGLLLFVGIAVTIIFGFGCVGLIRANNCMLITFSSLLSVILLMEIAGGITAYILSNQAGTALNKTLHDSLDSYGNNNATRKIWDDVQQNLHCCGVNGTLDYVPLELDLVVPVSCCINTNCTTTDPKQVYQDGCLIKIQDELVSHASLMLRWSSLVSVCHLVWITGSCCFARNVRRTQYETV